MRRTATSPAAAQTNRPRRLSFRTGLLAGTIGACRDPLSGCGAVARRHLVADRRRGRGARAVSDPNSTRRSRDARSFALPNRARGRRERVLLASMYYLIIILI